MRPIAVVGTWYIVDALKRFIALCVWITDDPLISGCAGRVHAGRNLRNFFGAPRRRCADCAEHKAPPKMIQFIRRQVDFLRIIHVHTPIRFAARNRLTSLATLHPTISGGSEPRKTAMM